MRSSFGGLCILFFAACGGGSSGDAGADLGMPDSGHVCASDSECSDGLFCNGVERCMPGVTGADARGCLAPTGPACLATMVCDEAADACQTQCEADPDADSDGHDAMSCGGDDCDDANALRYPGNVEVCDGADVDEDCEPTTFGTRDFDDDGFVDGLCCNADGAGGMQCGDDCNDSRRDVNPTTTEACDGVDNNCNGLVDEGVTVPGFADHDHDGYGDDTMALDACPGATSFAVVGGDCDDTIAASNPGLPEACDGVDNDCDGTIDDNTVVVNWYADSDGDGFGDRRTVVRSCAPPSTGVYVLIGFDCDDTHDTVNPAAAEICDGLDDDCNGRADFPVAAGGTEDDDLDRHGDAACGGDDCNDLDATTFMGATELCDMRDNNCNGTIDEGTSIVDWYVDADHDGDGSATATAVRSCPPIPGSSRTNGDCNDADATIHVGAAELCDRVDQNCDGSVAGEDVDMDGFLGIGVACTSGGLGRLPATDCDDTMAAVHVGVVDVCNGIDDDCSGVPDDDAWTLATSDMNCMTCGHACGAGQHCAGGTCMGVKRVFATLPLSAAFGGFGGADTFCQGIAGDAGFTGTFKAFLSTATTNATARMSHATVPYVLPGGAVVANNWTDLVDGTLAHTIDQSSTGAVLHSEIWTGSDSPGTFGGTGSCGNWTSAVDTGAYPCVGVTYATDDRWACAYEQFCNRADIGLYCFEQ